MAGIENFKKSVIRDFEDFRSIHRANIIEAKSEIKRLQGIIKHSTTTIDTINASMETLDSKIAVIEEESKWLLDNGFTRMDGRVAKAIEHRKLGTIMNMKKRPTSLESNSAFVQYKEQYWCEEWFNQVIRKIPTPKRQRFYETLEELKNDKDELEMQIGLWLLQD